MMKEKNENKHQRGRKRRTQTQTDLESLSQNVVPSNITKKKGVNKEEKKESNKREENRRQGGARDVDVLDLFNTRLPALERKCYVTRKSSVISVTHLGTIAYKNTNKKSDRWALQSYDLAG